VDELLQVLHRLDVSPRRLEVELTEAVALKYPEQAETTLRRLHEAGFRVALDDFGTGYSSMSYLKRYAIDKLKIDQSFVRELADQTSDQAIVTAIVRMAQSLHMATLAEGVETAEQARLLQDLGCGEIQGYWYSRPLEPAAFEAFARQAAQQASHSAT
jgi:EAL domain-containing protein (putative c-di-GMP-specific phosphodiesterase class I)